MKKKVIALFMSAALITGLCACGSSTGSESNSESTSATTETASASEDKADTNTDSAVSDDSQSTDSTGDETDELVVWCWDAFNVDAMKLAGDIYSTDHPNVTIKVEETVSADIQTLVQTYAMGGQLDALPDVFLMDDQVFAKYLQNYPEVFADLTDSGIPFSDFASAKVANSVRDGKNYGVPYDSNTVIACYRTDYLEQAGYSIADLTDITWERFIEIGKDVLAQTGMPMLTNVQGEPDLLNMILQSAGISVFDENGKISLVNNDGLKEAMNVYMELVQSGVLQEQTDWSGYQGSINNGTVVGTINGSWICATIMSTDQAEQVGNWAVTNMPKLNNDTEELCEWYCWCS